MKAYWWKILGIVLVLYSIVAGLLRPVPALDVLNESIRNLYYHVPMWFSMILLLLLAFIYSIKTLGNPTADNDRMAESFTITALVLGLLGILTGMIWAKYTWGAYWTDDPKLNGVAIGMLIYLGNMVLRKAIDDGGKRARVGAVFNIFAFPIFVVLIFILPRLTESLHPGNGGNPGFGTYDLDSGMRAIFYPAVIGWMLIGIWMAGLNRRLKNLESRDEEI